MIPILLLGNTGQLGWELQRTLAPLGRVVALDYPEIDLLSPETVLEKIKLIHPRIIVNATAYTAVDRAETETDLVMKINGQAPALLADAAIINNAVLIHYSTDYVFDGAKGTPYLETDLPNPLNIYGKSKLSGEQEIAHSDGSYLILRTSWVYSLRRESFVTKILEWSRQKPHLQIVDDQISNPTWARMLAEITAQLLALAFNSRDPADWINERRGIYHLAGDGYASRFEWAQAILQHDPHKSQQVVQGLVPALTSDFPTPAVRPLFSALDCTKFTETFHLRLPPWEDALKLALNTG